ncbi:MAG: glycosyltransferase family 2 protein [Patescibacteria group bacterium]
MQDISIIIVNYNANTLTKACLASLQELDVTGLRLHILVVDNASNQPFTFSEAEQKKYGGEVLTSSANLGFTGGNNLGIHHAIEKYNSDYVLLLNNDTTVAPDLLMKMVDRMNTDQQCGVLSPKIYFSPGREFHSKSYTKKDLGTVLWYAGGSIDWLNLTAFHRGVDEVNRGQCKQQTESDFATGCCLLIRREVLEKIGLLDKNYFVYMEDVDWSVKAKRSGYSVGYIDDTAVWHVNAGSSQGSGSALHQYYQTRNTLLFFFKYGSWRVRFQCSKLVVQYLSTGNTYQKTAALHFLLRQFGKQPVYIEK